LAGASFPSDKAARDLTGSVEPFFIINGITLVLCLPWIIFLLLNYKGQPIVDKAFIEEIGTLKEIIWGLLNDWVPLAPLTIISILLLFLFLSLVYDLQSLKN
jgi:hypothetical protein